MCDFILVRLQLSHMATQNSTHSSNFRHELLPSINLFISIYNFVLHISFTLKTFGSDSSSPKGLTSQCCSPWPGQCFTVCPYLLCVEALSEQRSAARQQDEFNIKLHNSALPSCLQLKRIFHAAFIGFHSINHSFSRGIRYRARSFLWV